MAGGEPTAGTWRNEACRAGAEGTRSVTLVLAALLGLSILCLLLRLPNLRELPIFCDEAIYLRWAQAVRENLSHNAFISLNDPKPPLHSWLLALVWPLTSDPLLSGRLLSVFAGVLTVPATALAVRELARLAGATAANARRWMVLAPALVVFNPFIAFYQRMALADSLFLLETMLAAWLGVRLALDVAEDRVRLPHTLLLGAVMGAAMLTRQSISYVLWLLPLLALGALWFRSDTGVEVRPDQPTLRRWARQMGAHLLLAGLLTTLLWLPVLLAPSPGGFMEKVFNSSRFVQPLGPTERLSQLLGNALLLLEWYSVYLTPAMLALGMLSLLWLVRRGHRSLAFFLCGWFLLMVLPLALAGSRLYPRYFLYGVAPLLLAGGLALAEGVGTVLQRVAGWRGYAAAAGVGALLLALPGESLGLQILRPHSQPLAPVDRWQYRDGWPAGYGSQAALRVVQDLARRGPIIVVTWDSWGTPSDVMWVYLKDNPNVTLYYTERRDGAILGPEVGPNEYLLADNKWSREPSTSTRLPAGVPVYYVNRVTSNSYGLPPALIAATPPVAGRQALAALNPGIREIASVPNGPPGTPPEQVDQIAIFRLK